MGTFLLLRNERIINSLLNKNICLFDSTNHIIKYSDYSPFTIDGFDDADVWLIEIDGKMHNIINNLITISIELAFFQMNHVYISNLNI